MSITPRKRCKRCGKHRYLTKFYTNRGKPRPECRDCQLESRSGGGHD